VKAELEGKRVKCPACGQALTVPADQLAAAQSDDDLDLGQLAGVEEAAATTLGAPLSQVKKKEPPANTRLIVGLSAGAGGVVLLRLLAILFWPSGEDKELAKDEAAPAGQSPATDETPPATAAAGRDEQPVRRWQFDHSQPPPDLPTLTRSAGMETVPADPYTDQPLRMSTMMGWPVIYSIGPDGKDDRGSAAQLDQKSGTWQGDFAFHLPPPQ
jgi:hypothetical protein